jgi:AraC-like DNA-binding protein
MVDLSATDTLKIVHSVETGYSTLEHIHDDHAMILIPRSGTMRVVDQFTRQSRQLELQYAYYVSSGLPHATQTVRSTQKHIAFYLNSAWEQFMRSRLGIPTQSEYSSAIWALGKTSVDLLQVLDREHSHALSRENKDAREDWECRLAGLIAEDCLRTIQTNGRHSIHPYDMYRGIVAEAIELLVADISAPPSIDVIAERCGISRRHMVRVFRQQTGKSIHGFLKDQRYRHAYDQVINTQWSLQQIALSVGVESAASFSTGFREKFGVSPSSLRKKKRFGL